MCEPYPIEDLSRNEKIELKEYGMCVHAPSVFLIWLDTTPPNPLVRYQYWTNQVNEYLLKEKLKEFLK